MPTARFGKATREGIGKGSDSPGPGNYDVSTKPEGPKFSLSGRWKVERKNTTPGPGNYEVRKNFDRALNTPFSKDARRGFVNEKMNKSLPGPG